MRVFDHVVVGGSTVGVGDGLLGGWWAWLSVVTYDFGVLEVF